MWLISTDDGAGRQSSQEQAGACAVGYSGKSSPQVDKEKAKIPPRGKQTSPAHGAGAGTQLPARPASSHFCSLTQEGAVLQELVLPRNTEGLHSQENVRLLPSVWEGQGRKKWLFLCAWQVSTQSLHDRPPPPTPDVGVGWRDDRLKSLNTVAWLWLTCLLYWNSRTIPPLGSRAVCGHVVHARAWPPTSLLLPFCSLSSFPSLSCLLPSPPFSSCCHLALLRPLPLPSHPIFSPPPFFSFLVNTQNWNRLNMNYFLKMLQVFVLLT